MGKKIQWIDETNINMHQKDGKRKVWRRGTAHDLKKHPTSSVKNGSGSVMAWAWVAVSGIKPLAYIDDVTSDRSITMNSEV